MTRRSGLIRRIEAGLLLPLAGLLRRVSPRARVAIGHGLGRLTHLLDRKHRRLARENIARTLGVDQHEAAAIARASFLHFGRVTAECLAMPAYAGADADRLFEVEGLQHLRDAHARGRGVIVFSAHMGNWELTALRQALAGLPMDLIARPLDNPWLEQALARWRQQTGNLVLGKTGALRRAIKSLRDGRCLAILIDQNVNRPPRLFVPFFDRPAATAPSLGSLAVRVGAPVVPVISHPRDDGGYRIVYQPEMEIPTEGETEERVQEVTLRATRQIEDWIRGAPGTWLWLHNRWKSRPDEAEGEHGS